MFDPECFNKLDFRSRLGKTCHYQAVSDILLYYGYDIPEEFVFLLFRGFFEMDPEVGIPYFTRNVFEIIGFRLLINTFKTKNEFIDIINDSIMKGLPIIANVKVEKLTYFPDSSINEINKHVVVVYGCKKDKLLISDSFVPYYPPEVFNGFVDTDAFIEAIMEGNDAGKVFAVEKECPQNLSLFDIFNLSIKKVLDILLEENIERCNIIEKSNMNDLEFPIDSIERIAKDTRSILLSNGGPVETRSFLSDVFRCVAQRNNKYENISNDFYSYYKRWLSIANACIRFSVINNIEYFKKRVYLSYELSKEEIQTINLIKKDIGPK